MCLQIAGCFGKSSYLCMKCCAVQSTNITYLHSKTFAILVLKITQVQYQDIRLQCLWMSVWNFIICTIICTGNLVILLIKDFYVPKNLNIHISTTIAQNSTMGVYFRNFNPLVFAEFSLPRTKIRPKHSEGVVWAQSKGHFRTKHPWKPLHNMLPVWLYLWILKFWNFLSLGVIYLIGGQLATSRQSWVVVYIY